MLAKYSKSYVIETENVIILLNCKCKINEKLCKCILNEYIKKRITYLPPKITFKPEFFLCGHMFIFFKVILYDRIKEEEGSRKKVNKKEK